MRLSVLDTGHRLRARLFLAATGRGDPPDIVRTLLYRPEFFARPLLEITAPAMRGRSAWTAGEREYLALTTAQRHRCPFCVDSHRELTRIAGLTEPVRPEVRAVRAFLDAVRSGEETRVDLPEPAVRDALHVDLVWNVVNRIANAFGFVLRGDQVHTGTRALHRFGYRFPAFLLAGGGRTGHRDPVANLRHAVFEAPAVTPPGTRLAAGTDGPLAEPWRAYAALVRDASYRITDADLTALPGSEDEIFELTAAAAVGAALTSYETGLRALDLSRG